MTAKAQALRDERARFLFLWVIPIALAGAVSFATPILNDGDTFWHIAAGRWMIAHGAVPATDPFSFTFAGRPWMAHEWLSEFLMAGAYRAAGWGGVMLLAGLVVGALSALMGSWLLRWLAPLAAIAAIALGLACVAPSLLARPHLLVLPLLALWTIGLLKAREEGRAPRLALALVMALWANLHASFMIGFVIAAAFALEAALDFKGWRRRTLIGWTAFLGASAVAAVATPHGLAGLAFPLQVLSLKASAQIAEWQAPDFSHLSTLELALLGGLFAAFWRGVRLSAVRAALIAGLVHLSLQHLRHEMILGVAAPLILAEPFGRTLRAAGPAEVRWRMPAPQTALGAGLAALILVARLAVPEVRTDGPTAPITALARTPPALRAQPVLNDYDFGGYLIFEGVRPFIDGRADMYGDAFMAEDGAIQNGDGPAAAGAIARYHIRWAILSPGRPLVGVLRRTPGWRRLYADRYAVVLERAPTPSSPAPAPARRPSAPG